MDNREDLIISAITEMKQDIRGVNEEIKAMNKTMASLASVHHRLSKIEDETKDLPKIRLITQTLTWVTSVVVMYLVGIFIKGGS